MKALPLGIGSIAAWLAALASPLLDLAAVLCSLFFAGASRYHPRDGLTYCNVWSQDVCEAFGLQLPRNTLANDLVIWLASDAGKDAGWVEVAPVAAQTHADEGGVSLACLFNPTGKGHIAPIAPSLGEPDVWISNVGAHNFLRGRFAEGFGVAPGKPHRFFINTRTP